MALCKGDVIISLPIWVRNICLPIHLMGAFSFCFGCMWNVSRYLWNIYKTHAKLSTDSCRETSAPTMRSLNFMNILCRGSCTVFNNERLQLSTSRLTCSCWGTVNADILAGFETEDSVETPAACAFLARTNVRIKIVKRILKRTRLNSEVKGTEII